VEWLDCPECGLPAFVVHRFALRSTDGPIPHAVTVCPRMHHLSAIEDGAARPAPADPTPPSSCEEATPRESGAA